MVGKNYTQSLPHSTHLNLYVPDSNYFRLQVASKYMAPSSIILGIDLDPIKPVQRCQTFQEDITTPECISRVSA